MLKIYKDQFETESDLLSAIEVSENELEIWRASEGIPAPFVPDLIRQIVDGEEYEYTPKTIEELKIEAFEKEKEEYEDEKLEAQTIPSEKYAEFRSTEYPSMPDQLDYIYHNGVDAWKTDMVDPVKEKYPKPEA